MYCLWSAMEVDVRAAHPWFIVGVVSLVCGALVLGRQLLAEGQRHISRVVVDELAALSDEVAQIHTEVTALHTDAVYRTAANSVVALMDRSTDERRTGWPRDTARPRKQEG